MVRRQPGFGIATP
jgi:hypothetical protein